MQMSTFGIVILERYWKCSRVMVKGASMRLLGTPPTKRCLRPVRTTIQFGYGKLLPERSSTHQRCHSRVCRRQLSMVRRARERRGKGKKQMVSALETSSCDETMRAVLIWLWLYPSSSTFGSYDCFTLSTQAYSFLFPLLTNSWTVPEIVETWPFSSPWNLTIVRAILVRVLPHQSPSSLISSTRSACSVTGRRRDRKLHAFHILAFPLVPRDSSRYNCTISSNHCYFISYTAPSLALPLTNHVTSISTFIRTYHTILLPARGFPVHENNSLTIYMPHTVMIFCLLLGVLSQWLLRTYSSDMLRTPFLSTRFSALMTAPEPQLSSFNSSVSRRSLFILIIYPKCSRSSYFPGSSPNQLTFCIDGAQPAYTHASCLHLLSYSLHGVDLCPNLTRKN